MRDEDWETRLGVVLVAEKPSLLALYRADETHAAPTPGRAVDGRTGEVVAWAVALPNGAAVVMPLDSADNRPILTTMRVLRRRWAPLLRATLVQVSGRETLRPAA